VVLDHEEAVVWDAFQDIEQANAVGAFLADDNKAGTLGHL
jgi:hypothetical protein